MPHVRLGNQRLQPCDVAMAVTSNVPSRTDKHCKTRTATIRLSSESQGPREFSSWNCRIAVPSARNQRIDELSVNTIFIFDMPLTGCTKMEVVSAKPRALCIGVIVVVVVLGSVPSEWSAKWHEQDNDALAQATSAGSYRLGPILAYLPP